jgi:hypothetical protein
MSTSTTQELDTSNLDFFYANYANSFGIGFHEDTPNKLKPIPPSIKPTQCLTKSLRGSTKTTHFFKALILLKSSNAYVKNSILTLFLNPTNLTIQLHKIFYLLHLTKNKKILSLTSQTLLNSFHPLL